MLVIRLRLGLSVFKGLDSGGGAAGRLENGLSPFEKIFMEGFFEWAMTFK
jgi:hypothetical protein